MTLQDSTWLRDEAVLLKDPDHNWSRDPTVFGVGIQLLLDRTVRPIRLALSPDRKWLRIGPPDGKTLFWMYITQPGDDLRTPDGSPLAWWKPGQMMRVNWEEPDNPKSKIVYQYMWQKVAHLNASGEVVKTPEYDALRERVLAPMPKGSTPFCLYFNCGMTKRERIAQLEALRDGQYYVPAPPATRRIER